ncbi:MAG: hypothetical protein GY716_09560, partial [bacterium]|nr:hypothetical protein [bacterium]
FDNINKLIGGPGSTLVGPDADTVWDVTGPDAGTITSGGLSMDFEGFGSLTGQSHDDTFVMHDGGSLSGQVDGGGGAGTDTLDYSNYTTDVTVNLSSGAAENIGGLAAGTGSDVGSSIENVFGGSGNDTITGDGDANILRDGPGSDVMSGGDGDDIFQLQPDPAGTSHDYLMDASDSGGDWVDFSQVDSAIPGVTMDMDIVGWDADGLVDVNDPASVDEDAPQDVYNGSLVSLLGVGPEQEPPADSPFENVLGSPGDDTLLIDPGDDIRIVDGGGGNDTPLLFDAGGSATIDTGDSITALGIGSVVYRNIIIDPIHVGSRIIDDGDVGFNTIGGWGHSSSEGYEGDERFAGAGDGSQVATWTFNGASPGWYRVSVTWQAGGNRTRDALFNVLDGTTDANSATYPTALNPADEAPIKQKVSPLGFRDEGTMWQDLTDDNGQSLYFEITGHTLTVELTNLIESGYVMADGVRIERVSNPGLGESEIQV